MMSASLPSHAIEMAGTISVPRSMQRMRTVDSGSGIPTVMKLRNGDISGMLDERVYAIDFFRLSKIRRPSSTPFTIEAKLSSRRIMSAASFETSVPAMPIATPMLAFLSAGASLTPSPVTATTLPFFWNWSTIMSFCLGLVRANTISLWLRTCGHQAGFSVSVKLVNVFPGTTMAGAKSGSCPMHLSAPWGTPSRVRLSFHGCSTTSMRLALDLFLAIAFLKISLFLKSAHHLLFFSFSAAVSVAPSM
mmetsp:Transcript_105942/g.257362  ORF Transcript_105942/g.257362 Transcript_105942/m.257362 type:complete len:248 (-) Transcript_105942:2817-3560(-)